MAAATALYAALEAARERGLVVALGATAVVVLAAGLAKAAPTPLTAAAAGLGACWTFSAWTRGSTVPGGTAVVAAAIFVVAELAFFSLEQAVVRDEAELVARRIAELALAGVLALTLAAVLLTAAGVGVGGGLVLEAVGVAAAVAVVALVFVLARVHFQAGR